MTARELYETMMTVTVGLLASMVLSNDEPAAERAVRRELRQARLKSFIERSGYAPLV
jgi:hypothetical protein